MTQTPTTRTTLPDFIEKAQGLSHFNWSERWIPLDDLRDDLYPEPMDPEKAQAMIDFFEAGAARTIFVSKRDDGSYVILDGRTTRYVLRQVGLTYWVCRIFYHMTPENETNFRRDHLVTS